MERSGHANETFRSGQRNVTVRRTERSSRRDGTFRDRMRKWFFFRGTAQIGDKQTDRRKDLQIDKYGQTDGRTDRQTNIPTEGKIDRHGQIDGRTAWRTAGTHSIRDETRHFSLFIVLLSYMKLFPIKETLRHVHCSEIRHWLEAEIVTQWKQPRFREKRFEDFAI